MSEPEDTKDTMDVGPYRPTIWTANTPPPASLVAQKHGVIWILPEAKRVPLLVRLWRTFNPVERYKRRKKVDMIRRFFAEIELLEKDDAHETEHPSDGRRFPDIRAGG